MRQQGFSESSFEKYHKPTRREQFLAEMDHVIPWKEMCKVLEPFYPEAEGAGRPPIGIERMLRIHFLQHWFNLSDPSVEETLYDSRSMRQFVGIDLTSEPVPDETTICKFRHILEEHDLGSRLFKLVGEFLAENGLKVNRGTIVDATVINAPSSTKNEQKARDPEMHQTKKGNQWYFGMKAHIGVDSQTKMIHSLATTSANVHDSVMLPKLLHGNETRVWGDAAYTGQREVIRKVAPCAKDFTKRKGSRYQKLTESDRLKNRNKSRIRAKVEHPFLVIKRIFGFVKVRYRGLMKNTNWLYVTCGLTNLYMARQKLMGAT